MIYDILAPIYDKINSEIDYSSWADFIEQIIKREYKGSPELVLDLACGTGRMTLELAKRGYDMTGVDYSPEMLDRAREAADTCGLENSVLWLCQDMCSLDLYGTVDVCVCCLDSINHLTSKRDLDIALGLVHNYLVPDGLFIFDINGKFKFENIYSDRVYTMEEDSSVCVWENDYNPKTGICRFYITLFSECPDGRYERYDEVQSEKMYTLKSMKKHLLDAGFEFVGAYSDFEFTEGSDKDERIYIVARCKKPMPVLEG